MRYMRWGWLEYEATPLYVRDFIVEQMLEQEKKSKLRNGSG